MMASRLDVKGWIFSRVNGADIPDLWLINEYYHFVFGNTYLCSVYLTTWSRVCRWWMVDGGWEMRTAGPPFSEGLLEGFNQGGIERIPGQRDKIMMSLMIVCNYFL